MRYFKTIASPVGKLTLIASDTALKAVHWDRADLLAGVTEDFVLDENHPILLETEKQLNEYFAGSRKEFDLVLDFEGTDFQKKVWLAMMEIPFGETKTYGQIAKEIGIPDAVRAVGGAANKNPIPIIGPCHRIIGANGKLVGFGGGLAHKSILLNLEKPPAQLSLWD
ncbi:methylated-DNA--[protein]-cysteine S-methyltransferase [Dyadobacter luticola]|uniref:Methylated-DNA--protein-cysteine methyltransferase n=1 Tax=Dyadobacter luticola TaxID=1979387 RepID=A0A5R9L1U1_9BACT|nr:methylated-DNA--[protein]-cysteine S-methyltransferase [Dyadobacter luticola]TLV02532.1 methylated-DNA--[protein]-cysteine S-methyltransferase [Dyadobacter luticola]